MNLAGKPRRKPEYQAETMDGELLLYAPGGNKILQLNPTAVVVWQLCDGARSVSEIISLLQAAYPDSAVEIPVDVQEILQVCLDQQCIELA